MNTVIISPKEITQEIKSNNKKEQKIEVGKNDDLFGTLISNLLKEENPDNSSNFLINKILDKSSYFEEQEALISDFSKGSLQTNYEIGHISIQELLEIAIRLKKGEELPNFPTDSSSLKTALSSPKVITEFKNAKNITDLLKIAEKNDIKIKNFQFFKENTPLLPKDKKVLSTITSEDIFKLIDKKVPTEKLTQALIEKKPEPKKENSLLQDFLFGKTTPKKEIKSEISSSFSHENNKDVKKKLNKTINQKIDIKEQPKNIQPSHESIKNIDQKIDIKEQPKNIQPSHESIKTTDQKIDIKEQTKNIQPSHESIKTTDQKIDIKEQTKNIQPSHESIKTTDHKIDIKEQTKNIQPSHESIKNIDQKIDIKEQTKNIQPSHESIKNIDQKIDIKEQTKNIQPSHESIKTTDHKIDIKEQPKSIDQKAILKEQISNIQKESPSIIKILSQQIKKIQTKIIPQEQKVNNTKNELLQKIQHSQISSKNIISGVQAKQDIETLKIKTDITAKAIDEEIQKVDINQDNKAEEKSSLLHELKGEKIEKTKFNQDIKRTLNTFAQDFKEQVDNYKSPLMKVKMQLNPKNMGDVDVTLINRGNNLHVNIQANSNTLAMFLNNHVEFKNSLINMGFSGLQMNFAEHNKDRQNDQQRRGNSKNNLDNEEKDSNEIEDINLVIPRYI